MNKSNENSCQNALPWAFLEGENLCDPNVVYSPIKFIRGSERIQGKFYITNFRFYFKSDEFYKDTRTEQSSASVCGEDKYLVEDIPLGLLQKVEKIFSPFNSNDLIGIVVTCKNARRMVFLKEKEDEHFEKNVFIYLIKYAFPLKSNQSFFAFTHNTSEEIDEGWKVYNPQEEYKRMGIPDSKKWRITSINKDYKFCETYPNILVVPHSTDDLELDQVAEFRSRNRIPVLSWIRHDSSNVSKHNPAILRSSQPLCGMSGKRSLFDEMYLKKISEANEVNKLLNILDARPYLNALANCTTGGGYENEKYYTSSKLSFLNIENIHVMRDSLNSNIDKDIILNTENSKWLEHIKAILDGVLKVVYYINRESSVLIHCSDGWDRTAQLTSLSMLMMDKYYRTIKGFEVLVEKEWLSFGHRFETRMGHGSDNYADQDRSPIFLQFIDCVWQLLNQNEKFFEFNEKFLLEIAHHMFTCQFGTFLFDSEYKRHLNETQTKTKSLWTHINSNLIQFQNNDYVEFDRSLQLSTEFPILKTWHSYYSNISKDVIDGSLSDAIQNQKTNDSISTIFENIAPTILSNGYKLLNHIKSNLRN